MERLVKGFVEESDKTRIAVASDTVKGVTHIAIRVKGVGAPNVTVLDRDQLLEHINTCQMALHAIDYNKDTGETNSCPDLPSELANMLVHMA